MARPPAADPSGCATSHLGDPDEVGEQVQALLDAGIDGLIFNMPDPHDLDSVALAGETLVRAFDGATRST